jgi:hypothetical protein
MSALACIRVFIGADLPADKLAALAPLVGRVGTAFLEGRWQWPRRHALVSAFAFALADPRAFRMDPQELRTLAAELQHRLFGDQGVGEVCLLMLEGDESETMRFAGASREDLRRAMAGDTAGLTGRLTEIREQGVRILAPDAERTAPIEPALRQAPRRERPSTLWQGLYQADRKAFIGSAAVSASRRPTSEEEALAQDLDGLEAARLALKETRSGVLFCPIHFSSIVRPSLRDAYLPALDRFDTVDRHRLAATVYDVPREPTFLALRQIKALTVPYFAFTDLQVTDPLFAVGQLPRETASSVTLCLPSGDARARLKAIAVFLAKSDAYRRAGVLQGLTHVDSRAELMAAAGRDGPFLSGLAVSDLLASPVRPAAAGLNQLPLRRAEPQGAPFRPATAA